MTPGGRVQAAIELLDAVLAPPIGREQTPADAVVAGYTRKRRYIGSKDRRAVTGLVWQALRFRGRALWAAGRQSVSGRELAVAALAGAAGWSDTDMTGAFDGSGYAPACLTGTERQLAGAVRDAAEPPPWAAANIPAWLAGEAEPVLAEAGSAGWQALAQEAPATLRVNSLKAGRDACLAALAEAGVDAAASALSPLGIALRSRANLAQLSAVREGWLESQDEGSQIAAALVAAEPGMRVLDYCAGGGGKSLALAAAMANEGTILATDTDAGRLAPLARRAQRAGATIVESRIIEPGAALDAAAFDRVLVDAPCSGSGSWRRQPESALASRPGPLYSIAGCPDRDPVGRGRLGRARRPSGLRDLFDFPGRERRDCRTIFAEQCGLPAGQGRRGLVGGSRYGPAARRIDGEFVRLLPHIATTDGFFIAIMERAGP